MTAASGVSPEALSLPSGGGAVHGLGGGFVPDLNTGGGTYTFELDLPRGVNGFEPKLTLGYATTRGVGPFGLGWDLGVLRIGRDLAGGTVDYAAPPRLMMDGAGPLLELDDGTLRPRVDALGWRIRRSGAGFECTDRTGTVHRLGQHPASRHADPADEARVFAWLLEESEDPQGERIRYTWHHDRGQVYLAQVDYAAYRIAFVYEDWPVPAWDGRPGFLIATALRCRAIEVRVPALDEPVIRRYDLDHTAADGTGHALLTSFRLVGRAADGSEATFPPTTMAYQPFAPDGPALRAVPDSIAAQVGELFAAADTDLADTTGDGLPDLVTLDAGRVHVARNLGDLRFEPLVSTRLPVPAATLGRGAFLADTTGRGRVDLVSVEQGLAVRYPIEGDSRFGRPRLTRRIPAHSIFSAATRIVDLDADGITDLLATGLGVTTLYRQDESGWSVLARLVQGGASGAPRIELSDEDVYVAPMKGDGLLDLVRVRSGLVEVWPYLGGGRWAPRRELANPPVLPRGFRRDRLFLLDLDGDGCTDVLYLDTDRVRFWLSRGGNGFSDERIIHDVPGMAVERVREADLTGSGTRGLLLVTRRHGQVRPLYLEPTGGRKPYLLASIDNGLGETTRIAYSTSSIEAARDRAAGAPWPTFLPFPVAVVARVDKHDRHTGLAVVTTFRYHDGHHDTELRRFLGFARVDTVEEGDDSAAGVMTTSTFHVGRDPGRLDQPPTADERLRFEALRGRLIGSEVLAPDGGPLAGKPYLRIRNDFDVAFVDVPGGRVAVPRQVETREEYLERADAPWRVTVTRTLAWDEHGNVLEQEQRNELADDPGATEILRTTTTYAKDLARWIVDRPARVTQRDGAGELVSLTVLRYDGEPFVGLPEGEVAGGLLTRREALVLTDAQVAAAYGDEPPDLAAAGYHRRDGEAGWWIDEVRFAREEAPQALSARDPRGNTVRTEYDAARLFPVRQVDARQNETRVTVDYRAARLAELTDANGGRHRNVYDGLGRLVAEHLPGDADDDPSTRLDYELAQEPPRMVKRRFPVPGAAASVDERIHFDGAGRIVEEWEVDDGGRWFVRSAVRFNCRALPARRYLPFTVPADGAWTADPARPAFSMAYDALGRPTITRNPDGSERRLEYGPGRIAIFDEEDSRTDAGAPHAATPTRYELGANGKIVRVVARRGAEDIPCSYRYDLRQNPIELTDAAGRITRIQYDLYGRRIRVDAPDSGTVTFVHDAAGNLIERTSATGARMVKQFDALNRLVRVDYPGSPEPGLELRWIDTADELPAAQARRRLGRLYQTVDACGTITYDYDERGDIADKQFALIDLPGAAPAISRAFDRMGRTQSITYPSPADGAPRRTVTYRYRGARLASIDGFIRAIEYDEAGRRDRIRWHNGAVTERAYDPQTARLSKQALLGGDGMVLMRVAYTHDRFGNILRKEALAPEDSWTYTYDDLYELTRAVPDAGAPLDLAYDPLGNIRHKSDVGDYRYGERGNPSGALTSAGAGSYDYDAAGRPIETPLGTLAYDALGRLRDLQLAGGGEVRIDHGISGERCRRRVTQAGVTRTTLYLDELVHIVDGALVLFAFDGERRVAQFSPDGPSLWLHDDHLGSVTVITDDDGRAALTLRYDPFGAVIARIVGPGARAHVAISFTGHELDDESGLVYAKARFYDPRLGRFLTPDMIIPDLGNPLSLNRYAYVLNNPVRLIDPYGQFWEEIGDWFSKNWKIIVAAVAVIAVVVLTIVTFGAGLISLSALIGVFGAMAAGGAVGGIAAARAGGSTEDILLGIFVGAAVAGAAALGGTLLGGLVMAKLGTGLLAHILAGAISGTLVGAATGFAAGFAGGQGTAGEIWDRMWKGALTGFIVGALSGVATYGIQQGWFGGTHVNVRAPTNDELRASLTRAAAETARDAGQAGQAGTLTAGGVAQSAATNVASNLAGNVVQLGSTGLSLANVATALGPSLQAGVAATVVLDVWEDLHRWLRDRNASVKSPTVKW